MALPVGGGPALSVAEGFHPAPGGGPALSVAEGWKPRPTGPLILILAACSCVGAWGEDDNFARARANAESAAETLNCCHRFVEGWLQHRDPATGLFPQNLNSPLWTPENSAADNYPFMVLVCYWTDHELLEGPMREILADEVRLTTRVRSLPDTVDLGTGAWSRPTLDVNALIFGAAEYCKDGLLPVSELMGRTEWFERLRSIMHDLCLEAPVQTQFGLIPSDSAEVNGETLQVVSRLYRATGDPVLLDMARRLADAYLLEVLPRNNGLPCHRWDFAEHKPLDARLSLNDHGNEIIGGLAEAVWLLRRYCPGIETTAWKPAGGWQGGPRPYQAPALIVRSGDEPTKYDEPFVRMIDRLLEIAVDEQGVWRGMVDTATGTADGGTPDTWGYAMNAVYLAYLMTGDEKYPDAVERAMRGICAHREWGGADAYADAIESGLVLLNRIPVNETFRWVEDMTAKMSAIQRPDGIIEGWHGDGNVARTWLMYVMWKTGGVRAEPWRPDLRYGACITGDRLYLTLWADEPWEGVLYFDRPRHREHFNLENYPRLNEMPEWFPIEASSAYELTGGDSSSIVIGTHLRRGWRVAVQPGQVWEAIVRRVGDPPFGTTSARLKGKGFIAGLGAESYTLTVTTDSVEPTTVSLSATTGAVAPSAVVVAADQPQQVEWHGEVAADTALVITARCEGELGRATHDVLIVDDPDVLDFYRCEPRQEYHGTSYLWLNDADIDCALDTGGEQEVVLSLLWGSKNDARRAVLQMGDVTQNLEHGGYDGFEWLDIPVPAQAIVDGKVHVHLTKPPEGKIAFISQIKLKRQASR